MGVAVTFERQAISNSLRFKVLHRDGFTCRYCGKMAPDVELQVDHIYPVSKGGTNSLDNLVAACVECNSGKSNGVLKHIPDTIKNPEPQMLRGKVKMLQNKINALEEKNERLRRLLQCANVDCENALKEISFHRLNADKWKKRSCLWHEQKVYFSEKSQRYQELYRSLLAKAENGEPVSAKAGQKRTMVATLFTNGRRSGLTLRWWMMFAACENTRRVVYGAQTNVCSVCEKCGR